MYLSLHSLLCFGLNTCGYTLSGFYHNKLSTVVTVVVWFGKLSLKFLKDYPTQIHRTCDVAAVMKIPQTTDKSTQWYNNRPTTSYGRAFRVAIISVFTAYTRSPMSTVTIFPLTQISYSPKLPFFKIKHFFVTAFNL